MSNKIYNDTRSSFFPNSRTAQSKIRDAQTERLLKRNTPERQEQLQSYSSKDAKVSIPDSIKDFARIKKAVDAAPPIDNSNKIARLKAQINNGTYEIDYDALADKMLRQEF